MLAVLFLAGFVTLLICMLAAMSRVMFIREQKHWPGVEITRCTCNHESGIEPGCRD